MDSRVVAINPRECRLTWDGSGLRPRHDGRRRAHEARVWPGAEAVHSCGNQSRSSDLHQDPASAYTNVSHQIGGSRNSADVGTSLTSLLNAERHSAARASRSAAALARRASAQPSNASPSIWHRHIVSAATSPCDNEGCV
eukprot:3564311-Rhodomonas_salina.1